MFNASNTRGIIIYVKNKNLPTLIEEILKHVQPGSKIWTLLAQVQQFVHRQHDTIHTQHKQTIFKIFYIT